MSSVCRVCLAGNMSMYSIKNNQLLDVYEKLSNKKFNSEDARPKALCCYCYRKLLSCHTFSQMAHRSEQLFSDLFHKGLEATHEYEKNTEVNLGIKQQLSLAAMPFISIDSNTTEAGSQVTIKDEPIPSIDIKEEMFTEQDNLVQVESGPEDCTKRQLTLEESDRKNDVEELSSNSQVEQTIQDDSKTKFICNICNTIFFFKRKLISHIRNFHSQVKGKQYAEKTSMIKGQFIHNRNNSFACKACDKRFRHKSSLVVHMSIHTGEKPFACNVCDKQFRQKKALISHIRIHTGEKPFACNVCDKQFCYKRALVSHMRIHTEEKPFACNVCDKQFRHKCALVSHIKIHTGEKPFVCNVCDKQFRHKCALVSHIKIHTGEKPFVCNVCDKQFRHKGALFSHIRIHTGEKPFACNICDKRLNQKESLVRHMRIHTGEKPFACNVCDKQFLYKSALVSHMRIHTGEKPFACDVCDKQFRHKGALVSHIKIHKREAIYYDLLKMISYKFS